MVRSPSSDENSLKKGPWTPEEDQRLIDYITAHGLGSWKALPQHAGLNRCGKSCRLRWTNYLRPDIRRGGFSDEEEQKIINLHSVLGNKWSRIATQLPGRTDNEIKNYWNTHLRKKLLQMGIDPTTHKPRTDFNHLMNLSQLLGTANLTNPWSNLLGLQADASHLARLQLLQNLLQVVNTSTLLNMENTGLLGNRNLNPFQGLVNRRSPVYNKEPFLTGLENMNPQVVLESPQAPGNFQNTSNPWMGFEGGLSQKNLGGQHTSSSSSLYENPTENPLPALEAASPGTDAVKKEETKTEPNQFSTHSTTSTIFDDWKKLMDDETSDSYWKDMLELTSSSASPLSW